MIAPIRQPDANSVDVVRGMHAARRLVASTLLVSADGVPTPARPVRRWQAWMLAVWTATVAAAYVAYRVAVR